MFSPYYAWARQRGAADPLHHCAINVALYERGGRRWAMTERGRAAVARTQSTLAIGSSALAWDGATLTVQLDEVTVPWPSRIRGTVRLHATALANHVVALDHAGLHHWQPLAPCARVEVTLEYPALRWSGQGYFDTNSGAAPLEDSFSEWHWSRARLPDGTAILYDVRRRDGTQLSLGRYCDARGIREFLPPPAVLLPATRWRVQRATRSDTGRGASVIRSLEDSPFYARSLVASRVLGQPSVAIHESLSLDRFRASWVRMLLPFRMPRAR